MAPDSTTPWRTDNWISSPWNYLPEITESFTLPATVQVHDVTLRDGEQQAGVEFTADEKSRIADALAVACRPRSTPFPGAWSTT